MCTLIVRICSFKYVNSSDKVATFSGHQFSHLQLHSSISATFNSSLFAEASFFCTNLMKSAEADCLVTVLMRRAVTLAGRINTNNTI